MNNETSLLAIKYIVARANKLGYQNGLWTILITKYLYLLDYYSAKTTGKPVTGIEWIMWNYGPWSNAVPQLIEEAVNNGYVQSKTRIKSLSEDDGYTSIYSEEVDDQKLNDFFKRISTNAMLQMSLDSSIKKYNLDSKALLHFVYHETEPVIEATKGDRLSFDNVLPFKRKAFEEPKLSRKTEKKAAELIARLKNFKSQKYIPPEGVQDETYLKAISYFDDSQEDLKEELKLIGQLKDVKFGSN